jgi:uncharacterized protein
MSNKAYRLLEYHQKLDSRLRAELKRRWPDLMAIARLKKLKLAVKDRLARLATRSKTQRA